MKSSDQDLIKRVLTGESEGFGELVRRYQGWVQGLAYHVMGNFEDAEDAAQEAFVTAYLKLRQLRHPEVFPAWLRQITLNCCKMGIRRRRNNASLEDVEPLPSGDPLSPPKALEREEMRRVVHQGLSQLTEDHRLVITLHYLGGLSYQEIAHLLGVPLGTVEGRMHRAKRQLKGRLMRMVENTLQGEKLPDEFARRVLDEALKRAGEARKQWAKEDFVHSCQRALEAAARLDDAGAQIEILSMLGEADATWLGEPEKAIREYETALGVARRNRDEGEEAKVLKGMFVAHARHGESDRMRQRAQEALSLFSRLGDRTGEAQARAALDLADALPGAWSPGQPGGYAMVAFPVETGADGLRFLDPKGIRNYSWGCPSRCTAFVHLLRPRRFLGPDLNVGATWEDPIPYFHDGLSWNMEKEDELIAKSTVESADDVVVTPAGKFGGCLRVRTCITPSGGGNAAEHSARTYCGTRVTWFAPGVGLVKLRHEDQDADIEAVYLVEHENAESAGYFPLSVGRKWRYRWVEWWRPQNIFEDTCRVVSGDGNVFHLSSATRATEQSEKETLSYFEKALEFEKRSNDLAGEAMTLEKIATLLGEGEKERKAACYERLISIYEALRDEWRLLEARWNVIKSRKELTPQETEAWPEEKLALAKKLGDRRKVMKALKGLAWHHRQKGEYEVASQLSEEAAALATEEGDAREASSYIASAELFREMSRMPPGPGVGYVQGEGYLVEKAENRLDTTGSARSFIKDEYLPDTHPSGIHGTPMTDLFMNNPFSGIELLNDDVGATSTDTLNTGVIKGFCESMRMLSTLTGKEEKVEVPAGVFSGCVLIETTISTSAEDRQLGPELERIRSYYAGVRKTWFAPGVGLVRTLYEHQNGYVTDIQLVEYQIVNPVKDYFPLALNNRWRYRWTAPESGITFEDSLRVASHKGKQWNIAFVTRARAAE